MDELKGYLLGNCWMGWIPEEGHYQQFETEDEYYILMRRQTNEED